MGKAIQPNCRIIAEAAEFGRTRAVSMHRDVVRPAAMKWQPVESATIAALGYDARFHQLGIEFRASGEVYLYFDVPAEEHAAFLAADSKGEYLNRVFKSKGYRYTGPHNRLKRTA